MAALLVVFLAACGSQPVPVSESALGKPQLLGRWQEGGGSQDPTLLLHADLGFQVFNWPVEAFTGIGEPTATGVEARVDGTGRWNLVGPAGEQTVVLRWQQAGSLGAPPPDSGRLVAGSPPRLRFVLGSGRDEVVQLQYVGPLAAE